MLREFTLPDLGEGLTESEVVAWRVSVGDHIELNQVIADIETAKAIVELPSPFAGTVAALHAEAGQTVDVGAPLVSFEVAAADGEVDENAGRGAAGAGSAAPGATGAGSAGAGASGAGSAAAGAGKSTGGGPTTTKRGGSDQDAGKIAGRTDEEPSESSPEPNLVGYGALADTRTPRRRPRVPAAELPRSASLGGDTPADRGESGPEAWGGTAEPVDVTRTERPRSTPPVRTLARELGVDLERVRGTGERGLITRADVEAAARAAGHAGAGAAGTSAAGTGAASSGDAGTGAASSGDAGAASADSTSAASVSHAGAASAGSTSATSVSDASAATAGSTSAGGDSRPADRDRMDHQGETRIPIKGVRKATAAAMVASAFTAPHVTEFLTLDVTASTVLIAQLKAEGRRVNILALTAKAVCIALARTPELNSRWDESAQEIVYPGTVNLGIAAATQRGLVVPNVKGADRRTLFELAEAIGDLASTAREGRTQPADLRGGTFTITNIGVFGIDAGTPILNPGEAGILALGAVRRMPWEHHGDIALRDVLTLSVSFDHRLVDGEQGSRFLADVGTILREPARVLAMV